MKTSAWILALFAVAAPLAQARAQTGDKAAVVASLARLPLAFERNRGQTDARVKFLARDAGYTLFLTRTGAVLALSKPDGPPAADTPADLARIAPETAVALRMTLVGANPYPRVEGRDALASKSNYFIGNDRTKWRTGVPQYARVEYFDVYPGIDLVYYGKQGRLEYDFVVAPYADPNAIRLRFEGAQRLRLDDAGNLVVSVPGGEVVQHAPLVYQEADGARRGVPGRYVLDGRRRVGFEVEAYDTGRPLVIDPVLSYSTYLGGNDNDNAEDIAVDADGYAYVTGWTDSRDFPIENPYQGSFAGSRDAFVTKLDPGAGGAASLVYSTYLGGSANDEGWDVAVDADGSAYVTGYTFSSDFPTENPYQVSRLGEEHAFVTKLDPSAGGAASLVYSTYLGGNSWDEGYGIAVHADGTAYVTGVTVSSDFPTENPVQGSLPGDGHTWDAFVTRLDPGAGGAASVLYSTYLGGNRLDISSDIAVDANGSVYVTGRTESSIFPTENPYQGSIGGTRDAFVTKLDPGAGAAGLLYSTYLGGNEWDYGRGIAVDAHGYAYVTGYTDSPDFPTASPYQDSLAGRSDAFVAVLDPGAGGAASLLYSTYLGGSAREEAWGIAVDAEGTTYVTGGTGSSDFPTASPYQGGNAACGGVFVTKLDPAAGGAASLLNSTCIGEGRGSGIAVGADGDIYVTGRTTSTDFPIENPFQGSYSGRDDAFVAVLTENEICDLRMSRDAYGDGEVVTADDFRLANGAPEPAPIGLNLWLEPPASPAIPLLSQGLGLPAGFDQVFGPLPLFQVTPSHPRGTYRLVCRLLDPLTGESLALDVNPFEIQ